MDGLVYLDVGDSVLTRALLARLGGSRALRSLKLRRGAVAMVPLMPESARSRLRRLYIGHSVLPDLRSCDQLVHLSLDNVKLPLMDFKTIQHGLAELRSVIANKPFTVAPPPSTSRLPRNLESIWLGYDTLDDAAGHGLTQLARVFPEIPRLRYVQIVGPLELHSGSKTAALYARFELPPARPLAERLAKACADRRIVFVHG